MVHKNAGDKKRFFDLDILKAIGILAVILAHVISKDTFIFQIRNFDVPLMVFVSGILFAYTFKAYESGIAYVFKRIFRLLIPTWIFAIFFFTIFSLIYLLMAQQSPFGLKEFFSTILLQHYPAQIGAWVIRVFLLMIPAGLFLIWMKRKLKVASFIFFLISSYLFYEFFYILWNSYNPFGVKGIALISYFVSLIVFYILPYGFVFSLGILVPEMNEKQVKASSFVFLCIFIVFFAFNYLTGSSLFTQDSKYPPRIFFLSYALAASYFLYYFANICSKMHQCTNGIFYDFVVFISSGTLWIFFWHFFVLAFLKIPIYSINLLAIFLDSHSMSKYFFVLIITLIMVYVQKKFCSYLYNRTKSEFFKKLLVIFLH
jgi:fucose 4-O-acetylase-like acetyltransferase